MPDIILIAHNIRSIHNIGSLFRTAEGLGIGKIIISGYSPYPRQANDERLPHIVEKMTSQIAKTALGAEKMVPFSYFATPPLEALKKQGYTIAGLEQDTNSTALNDFLPPDKLALVLGEEVEGIGPEILRQCDVLIEIPMVGKKESFNVSVAAGIALYRLTSIS